MANGKGKASGMGKASGKNGGAKGAAPNGAPAAGVAAVIRQAQALKGAIAALGLPGLTAEERLHADGRLRQGEASALTTIFDTMDAFPATFAALADKDGGSDPNVVETGPARAALAEATSLQPLAAILGDAEQVVTDAILALAAQAKGLSVPAYAIAKANAPASPPLRKSLGPALDFYGTQGRKRVLKETKAANKAKQVKKAAKPPSA